MKLASRMDNFEDGIFNVLNEKKNKLIKEGKEVFNLSIGTPDFEPDDHVMTALSDSAKNPKDYVYSLGIIDELYEAVINWYKNRYNVEISRDEIMAVNGSQEGFAHVALPFLNPDDVILVPNPGYPVFEFGPMLCSAKVKYYDLYPENNYLPDLDNFDKNLAKEAKVMVVSYPLNPVCKTAPRSFYEKLVKFAKDNDIIIIHDNAYSDIIYDGREGLSFLSVEGAKDVGFEFNSLSKTYNLTGARISFAIGNKEMISAFTKVRNQIDYGIFIPIQRAAVAALNGPQDSVKNRCDEYERRRNALCDGLTKIGWPVTRSEGSMFVWAKIPEGFGSSEEFVITLMEKTGLICTPGSAFGSLGEGYVRFALVKPVEEIEKIIQVVDESGMFK